MFCCRVGQLVQVVSPVGDSILLQLLVKLSSDSNVVLEDVFLAVTQLSWMTSYTFVSSLPGMMAVVWLTSCQK